MFFIWGVKKGVYPEISREWQHFIEFNRKVYGIYFRYFRKWRRDLGRQRR